MKRTCNVIVWAACAACVWQLGRLIIAEPLPMLLNPPERVLGFFGVVIFGVAIAAVVGLAREMTFDV